MGVGGRVRSLLEDAGQPVEEVVALPASLAGITPLVHRILLQLDSWQTQRGIGRVILCYNRPLSGVSYAPQTVYLLPLARRWLQRLTKEPWRARGLPTYSSNRAQLFSALIRQYLFVSLYQAFAGSLTSENASRLVSLQAAQENIEESLDELTGQYHRQRQAAITEELLDIVAGFEALASERSS